MTARLALAQVEDGRVIRMAKYTPRLSILGEGVDTAKRLLPECNSSLCWLRFSTLITREKRLRGCVHVTSAACDAENAPGPWNGFSLLGLEPMIPGEIEGALTFWVSRDFENHRHILAADSGGSN